jgi:hypothetical protein
VGVGPCRHVYAASAERCETLDKHASLEVHLQLIRDGPHLLHDFELTNPFQEKLAIYFAMLNVHVHHTQKNLISNKLGLFKTCADLHKLLVFVEQQSKACVPR